jgi:hypothetical protein
MSDNQAAAIARPIDYNDGKAIHACQSDILHRGIRLVWTKYDRDVLPDEGFTVPDAWIEVSCSTCLAALG